MFDSLLVDFEGSASDWLGQCHRGLSAVEIRLKIGLYSSSS